MSANNIVISRRLPPSFSSSGLSGRLSNTVGDTMRRKTSRLASSLLLLGQVVHHDRHAQRRVVRILERRDAQAQVDLAAAGQLDVLVSHHRALCTLDIFDDARQAALACGSTSRYGW